MGCLFQRSLCLRAVAVYINNSAHRRPPKVANFIALTVVIYFTKNPGIGVPRKKIKINPKLLRTLRQIFPYMCFKIITHRSNAYCISNYETTSLESRWETRFSNSHLHSEILLQYRKFNNGISYRKSESFYFFFFFYRQMNQIRNLFDKRQYNNKQKRTLHSCTLSHRPPHL